MRIMGLDFGSVTVGVAISDELLLTAQGIETIRRKKENQLRQTFQRIEELVKEYGVEQIVLGYPKNMNNPIGERAQKSEEFAEDLKRRTGLPVVLWDERLTTVAAHHLSGDAGRAAHHISSGCGGDGQAGGPQKGNIAHDDLTADRQFGGQNSCTDRFQRLFQSPDDAFAPGFGVHGRASFTMRMIYFIMKRWFLQREGSFPEKKLLNFVYIVH